jgi:glutamyl-tRNA synthetase
MSAKTRFAPSPTGHLHVGGARTALFSWLQARHHGGQFVLRIEDTDRERSTREATRAILDAMDWLGLDYDEGPFYQSERTARYEQVLEQLLIEGKAYRCYCSRERLDAMRAEQEKRREKPKYDGHCRHRQGPPPSGVSPVIRFRNPDEGQVEVHDRVRGHVTFANSELDDLVIARSDGSPTYNFTVVVDDADMGIDDVIRGDDHLNNTPRQINILHALGVQPPAYAHVPMILGPDGKRLSKRHGAMSVLEYRDAGYMPAAMLNYLLRLGWAHGDQEIFTQDEMIALFDIADVQRAAASFDPDKLAWMNHQYVMYSDAGTVAAQLAPQMRRLNISTDNGPALEQVVEAQRNRYKTLAEMAEKSAFFYAEFDEFEEKAARKNLKADAAPALRALHDNLAGLTDWNAEALQEAVQETARALDVKFGKVAQPLRVAVSGGAVSPPIDETLRLVGREATLARVNRALDYIGARADAQRA